MQLTRVHSADLAMVKVGKGSTVHAEHTQIRRDVFEVRLYSEWLQHTIMTKYLQVPGILIKVNLGGREGGGGREGMEKSQCGWVGEWTQTEHMLLTYMPM